jgi:hypothetical protein
MVVCVEKMCLNILCAHALNNVHGLTTCQPGIGGKKGEIRELWGGGGRVRGELYMGRLDQQTILQIKFPELFLVYLICLPPL